MTNWQLLLNTQNVMLAITDALLHCSFDQPDTIREAVPQIRKSINLLNVCFDDLEKLATPAAVAAIGE